MSAPAHTLNKQPELVHNTMHAYCCRIRMQLTHSCMQQRATTVNVRMGSTSITTGHEHALQRQTKRTRIPEQYTKRRSIYRLKHHNLPWQLPMLSCLICPLFGCGEQNARGICTTKCNLCTEALAQSLLQKRPAGQRAYSSQPASSDSKQHASRCTQQPTWLTT